MDFPTIHHLFQGITTLIASQPEIFPSAAPLFLSLFVGVAVGESDLNYFVPVIDRPLLYGATLFFGLILGVLAVRLIAPYFDDPVRSALAAAGQIAGVSGLFLIAPGVRRRISRAAEAATTSSAGAEPS